MSSSDPGRGEGGDEGAWHVSATRGSNTGLIRYGGCGVSGRVLQGITGDTTDGCNRHRSAPRAARTAVAAAFTAAKGLHGSPRLIADLRDLGWEVSEETVADSMRRQGLVARRIKRRNGLTKQDKTAPKFPDLVKRDFTAAAPNRKWVGDMTEIRTESGQKLYLATVIDLYSRRLLGRPWACTRMPTWRARRSKWPWPRAAAAKRLAG